MRKLLVIVLILAGGAGLGWWLLKKAPANPQTETPTATVKRGALRKAVSATGRVVANLDVDIKCKASGTIVTLPVDVSDRVAKGNLLMALDPVDEERNVAQATASLAAAQARLAASERSLVMAEATLATDRSRIAATLTAARVRQADTAAKARRAESLLAQGLLSEEEASTARTTASQAEADLATNQAQEATLKTQELALEVKRQDITVATATVTTDRIALDQAKQRLADTTVRSPLDGIIASRPVQIGAIISSGITNVGGGTTVMTVSDLSQLFVLAAVDESDIGSVRLGQEVNITADAFPGQTFPGTVERIATRGANASNVVTFEVKIAVTGEGRRGGPRRDNDGAGEGERRKRRPPTAEGASATPPTEPPTPKPASPIPLKPEMTANVEIVVDQRQDVLTVPVEALTRGKDGWSVQVRSADGSTRTQAVKTGLGDGTRTEITEGLAEGDIVVLRKAETTSKWRNQGPPMMMGPPGGRR